MASQRSNDAESLLMQRIADAAAFAMGAEALAVEAEESAIAVRAAIASAEASHRIRSAVKLAASRNAAAMDDLRLAICEFTFAHRNEGFTPEGVLISLKKIIEDRAMPPIQTHDSDWNGDRLRENISTWCIKAYFNAEGACT